MKKLITTLLSLSMLVSMTAMAASAEPAAFTDIVGHWAEAEILTAASAGVINGYEDGSFQPDNTVIRAEAAKIMAIACWGEDLDLTAAANFKDVAADAWYAPYVAAAVEAGAMKGVSENEFDPDGVVTRAQAAAMMVQALDLTSTSSDDFTDVAADAWYADEVAAAAAAGIVNGYKDGSFKPEQSVTRAELVVMLLRANDYNAQPELVTETITTDKGDIEGFAVKGSEDQTLYCYYGIPYAEAPVGELRWRDAQEKTAWEGTLDCTAPLTEQNSSYQWGTNLLAYFTTLNESEDCLYLNVTTPAETTDEALPVFVWFHGGGMFGGSGSEEVYNLLNLPEEGCIVVTVTHRLGAFGMLAADALGSTVGSENAGNFIISDMVKSLEWVRSNIAAFGGDPDNVTIAGESGGGAKVQVLMASPEAEGLFDRAIIQSGGASALPMDAAKETGNALMAALGVTTLEEAQAIPAEDVLAAYNSLGLDSSMLVDGYYLPGDPTASIVAGNYNKCDVLIGVNEGELPNLIAMMNGVPIAVSILDQVTADCCNAYAYELDQVPATWREYGFHCVHSLDLAYMFGEYTDVSRFYNGGPWEQNFMFWGVGASGLVSMDKFISPTMDEADILLSDYMIEMWVNFAKTGDPSIDEVQWDAWTAESQNYLYLSTMNGNSPEMRTGFSELEMPFSIG